MLYARIRNWVTLAACAGPAVLGFMNVEVEQRSLTRGPKGLPSKSIFVDSRPNRLDDEP